MAVLYWILSLSWFIASFVFVFSLDISRGTSLSLLALLVVLGVLIVSKLAEELND